MARPRGWWLAVLVGAAPHVVVLAHLYWPRTVYFGLVEGVADAIPFARYGRSELIIVPVTLLLTLGVAIIARTRRLALWLLLGTLAGATLVLLGLAQAAVSWQLVTAPPWSQT